MRIIGGKFRQRLLVTVKGDKVRPTTGQLRETLFNICQHTIVGARFLDLFAGSGAIGLEALSRGALHATFVEKDRSALAVIKKNIAALHVEEHASVYRLDVFEALQRLSTHKEQYDLIYVDPPYGEGYSSLILDFLDRHPLLTEGGFLFIEDIEFPLPPLDRLTLQRKRKVGNAQLYTFK
jgi:16S rRNA (guanine966-N2)-methyltransferase